MLARLRPGPHTPHPQTLRLSALSPPPPTRRSTPCTLRPTCERRRERMPPDDRRRRDSCGKCGGGRRCLSLFPCVDFTRARVSWAGARRRPRVYHGRSPLFQRVVPPCAVALASGKRAAASRIVTRYARRSDAIATLPFAPSALADE
jgi:hypothetical protein